ncbi:unnamed protein product [Aureobasidium pullulans]|nr:unnamed protein product [Aureobasidium pullulans]
MTLPREPLWSVSPARTKSSWSVISVERKTMARIVGGSSDIERKVERKVREPQVANDPPWSYIIDDDKKQDAPIVISDDEDDDVVISSETHTPKSRRHVSTVSKRRRSNRTDSELTNFGLTRPRITKICRMTGDEVVECLCILRENLSLLMCDSFIGSQAVAAFGLAVMPPLLTKISYTTTSTNSTLVQSGFAQESRCVAGTAAPSVPTETGGDEKSSLAPYLMLVSGSATGLRCKLQAPLHSRRTPQCVRSRASLAQTARPSIPNTLPLIQPPWELLRTIN